MDIRNMKIGLRLALGFGVILAVLVLVSIAGMVFARIGRDNLVSVMAAAAAKERLAFEMKAIVLEQSAPDAARLIVLAKNEAEKLDLEALVHPINSRFLKAGGL